MACAKCGRQFCNGGCAVTDPKPFPTPNPDPNPRPRILGALAVAVTLAVGALSGCAPVGGGIPVTAGALRFQFDCSMDGADAPGYKWRITYNPNDGRRRRNVYSGVFVPASAHHFVKTSETTNEIEFDFRAQKAMTRGYIRCDAYVMQGPGRMPAMTHLEKQGPTRDSVRFNFVIVPDPDGGFGAR